MPAQSMPAQSITRRFSAFAHRLERLPDPVRLHGEAALDHAAAQCRDGASDPSVDMVVGVLDGLGRQPCPGEGVAPVGRPELLAVGDAALVNAMAMRASDASGASFAAGHLPVAAAVLAVRDWTDCDDAAAVEAFCVGAEANQRVLSVTGNAHCSRGWDAPSLIGAFGAALATARLLQLSAGQTEHAMGLALTQGSGLLLAVGSMTGLLQAGKAAGNAVEAVLLARGGFTAPVDGLDARRGLLLTTLPDIDFALIDADLGSRWLQSTSAEDSPR